MYFLNKKDVLHIKAKYILAQVYQDCIIKTESYFTFRNNNYLFTSSSVAILTRFQSGSLNMLPTPWPSAVIRLALIL